MGPVSRTAYALALPQQAWLGLGRSVGRAARDYPIRLPLLLLLLGHLLVWTWVGISSRSNFDGPGDMVEAYVWAQGWQWGYFKHPPLAAWVTGLWFAVMPESQASFSLLATLNCVVGLAGLAYLAREFMPHQRVLLVVALASLTPGLTSLAMRFNCNAILVSTWPWAMALFVRMMNRGRTRDAIGCGVVCALAVLGKYYSAVLLLTLLAAALWLPAWRQRLFSRSFVWALMAFALCLAPHLLWLLAQTEGPLQYARTAAGGEAGSSVLRALNFALAQLAFPLIAMGVFALVVSGPARRSALLQALSAPFRPQGQVVWLLAALPIIATMLITVTTGARTASVWGLPIAGGLALLAVSRAHEAGASFDTRRLWRALLTIWLVVAVVSPLWWWARAQQNNPAVTEPREELAGELQAAWRAEHHSPLPWVTGTRVLAASVSFYAADHPRYWSFWNHTVETPWAQQSQVRAQGGVVVCATDDEACIKNGRLLGAEERELSAAKTHAGRNFAPQHYRVFIVAPQDAVARP
jgi:4-amino-4-deoxy-L-arabinose transferase-like glycosyltransferase